MSEVSAVSDTSFYDSIGVNMVISNGDSSSDINVSAEENALSYLGVTLVRGSPYGSNIAAYKQINQDLGIKYDFFVDGSSTAAFASSLSLIEANYGMVAYAEGPNESDETLFPTSYDGLTGLAATAAEMQVLYSAVHGDPQLAGVGVIQASFGIPATFATYGNHSGTADYTNSHIYYSYFPWGGDPDVKGAKVMKSLLADAQIVTPGVPNIVTETGYATLAGWGGSVSLIDQAKYLLDDVFDLWNAGVVKSFIYNLFDSGPSSPDPSEPKFHYGLYNADWTPKPAAIALHNLMTLLADSGTGGVAPGSLNFTLTGGPSSISTTLLEKSDGTFVLAIWNEVMLQNSSGVDTPVPAVPVTLTLGSAFESITVYDPLTGTSAVQSFSNAQTVQIMVPDHPVLIEISNTAPAPTIAAAGQPIINAPGTVLAAQDSVTQVGGISIGNDDTGNMTVQVTDSLGALSMRDADNQALKSVGTDSITLYGPAYIINAELATLAYSAPAGGGNDVIAIQVTGSTGAVVNDFITVKPIALPAFNYSIGPLLSVPTTMTVATGSVTAVSGAVLSDAYYALNPGQMTLTISAASGKIDILNDPYAPALSITGTYAQLAADLQTLTYMAGSNTGTDTLSFQVTDPGGAQSDPTIAITVAPALTIDDLENIQLVQGSTGAVAVQIDDPGGAGNSDQITVTVTDSTGTLTMLNGEGKPQSGSGTHSITVTASADWVNGELATLEETAPANRTSDTITVTAKNTKGYSVTSTASVKVVPLVSIAAPGSVAASTQVVTNVSGVSVTDATAAAQGLQMTVTVQDSDGKLSMTNSAGVPVSGSGGHSITLTGTLAAVNAQLATLTYTGPSSAQLDKISVTATDSAGGTDSGNIAVPVTAEGSPSAYFWLADTANDPLGRQTVMTNGSMVLTTAATGLNGAATEQAAHGVTTLGAEQWDTVNAITLDDNTLDNSYVLNNFVTVNANLAKGPTATGHEQVLTIDTAQNGSAVLGSGNQNLIIDAGLGGKSASSNNTFSITEGSGTDWLKVVGYAGDLPADVTTASVTAGAGNEVMEFLNAHAVVKAGAGNLLIYGSAYGTNVTAGTGEVTVWGSSATNLFTYHTGDGLMTIEDFSATDTLTIDGSLKAGMTTKTVSGGVELLFSASPKSEILLKGDTSHLLAQIKW